MMLKSAFIPLVISSTSNKEILASLFDSAILREFSQSAGKFSIKHLRVKPYSSNAPVLIRLSIVRLLILAGSIFAINSSMLAKPSFGRALMRFVTAGAPTLFIAPSP